MKTELTLPIEMYKLGLNEMGAIFILMASPDMEDQYKLFWEQNTDFKKAVADLVEDEIVITKNGEVEIDLTWV